MKTGGGAGGERAPLGRRERLHEIIFEADTPTGKAFDVALIVAILASVLVVILSTMPELRVEPWQGRLYAVEWVFTGLFTAEYLLRLGVVKRPIRYARSFFGIVDLLSILPVYLTLFLADESHPEALLVVRALRLLRVFRVLKLARYLSEATALKRAVIVSRHKIFVFLTAVLIIVVIASATMYLAEGQTNESLDSMPEAMYWAVITMTTVGYGDVTPGTITGKFITAALVLMGYAMIIVPTGILSAEITAHRGKGVSTQSCRACMHADHDPDAAFCKFCGEKL